MLKKIEKKHIWILGIVVGLLFLVFVLKTSFAYLYTTIKGERSYGLTVKGFSLKLDESSTSESIKIENSVPVSDEVGRQTTAYTFSITNEDSDATGYILYLDDVEIIDEVNRMKDINIKYQLIENENETVGLVSELGVNPLRILTYGILEGGVTNNYSVRFWIKEDAEVYSSQIFSVKLRIIGTSIEVIESGKLNPGETIITTEVGTTEMTNEQLQTYIERYVANALEEQGGNCTDCQKIISDAYDASKTYAAGDYVIYNNTLYKANQDITTPEDFDSEKWSATTIGGELYKLESNSNLRYSSDNKIQVYKNGVWSDLNSFTVLTNKYIFKNGEEYTDITGGWNSLGTYAGTNTKNDALRFSGNVASSDDNHYGGFITAKAIDVTELNRLCVSFSSSGNNMRIEVQLVSEFDTSISLPSSISTLDISELTGKYYVKIKLGQANWSYGQIIVNEVYFE